MSELKATTAQEIVRNEKDCDYMDELFGGVKMPPTQVYIKSEADKVIAKLENENERLKKQASCTFSDDCLRVRHLRADYKEACDRLQTANLIKDEQLAATRHSNYKRCLYQVENCRTSSVYFFHLCEREKDEGKAAEYRRVSDWFDKWEERWLKLAEKFKETNNGTH